MNVLIMGNGKKKDEYQATNRSGSRRPVLADESSSLLAT